MGRLDDWQEFRRQRPKLSVRIKQLGMILYGIGAEKAQNAPEFRTLKEALKGTSVGHLQLLGITELTDQSILRAVFELGGDMLLDAEQGGTH